MDSHRGGWEVGSAECHVYARADMWADSIARRCTTADAVAVWAKEIHDGLCGRSGHSGQDKADAVSTESTPSAYAEVIANGVLTLIAVACSLLGRQLASQARAFEDEGGFTERLYRVRSRRRRPSSSPESD